MLIARNTVVTLKYSVRDTDGSSIDEGANPLVYLHGGYDDIFPMIEEALHGKKVGESVSVTLDPADAFGDYDPKLVRMEPVETLPPDIAVGGYLVSEQDGEEIVWRVTDIAEGKAVLDGNHELAGQRVRFDATIVDVRPATQEEVTHGHVHGPHGPHHH